MGKIVFECKKCSHNLIAIVDNDCTFEMLMEKLRKVSIMDCPNCGEEPYLNWMLSDVQDRAVELI